MNSVTVLIAEDDDAVRDSLLMLLRGEGIRARAFSSGAELLANLPEADAACVITDVRMPDMDGTEVVRRLAEIKGSTWPVIVITGHADVPMAVQMMKAGVVDFIEKPFDPVRLLEAVRGCLGHLSEQSGERQNRQEIAERIAQLSQRETQVFRALVEGRSNKEIAADLEISPRTVEIFRAKVMSKMQAKSLSALVRMGLASPPE
ncbi:response regulator FixJ [Brevundimonas sp.]